VIDPRRYAPDLVRGDDGVWAPPGAPPAAVDFPAWGHAACRQVEDGSFWFAHRARCVLAALEAFAPPGPVFDLGGGNGSMTEALGRAGHAAVLVEPGAEGCRAARARGLEPIVRATVAGAGLRAGALPAAGLFDVLEHVGDDAGLLARLGDLLAPGGRLYVTVPAHAWLWSPADDAAGHHRRYTRGELIGRVQAAGLAVEHATALFSLLVPGILGLRALPARLGLAAGAGEVRAWEHGAGAGLVGLAGRAARRTLAFEAACVRRRRPLPLGASWLLVARRTP